MHGTKILQTINTEEFWQMPRNFLRLCTLCAKVRQPIVGRLKRVRHCAAHDLIRNTSAISWRCPYCSTHANRHKEYREKYSLTHTYRCFKLRLRPAGLSVARQNDGSNKVEPRVEPCGTPKITRTRGNTTSTLANARYRVTPSRNLFWHREQTTASGSQWQKNEGS